MNIMKKFLSVLPAMLPAVALASGASDEPSMLEAVIPFAIIALLMAALAPLVAKKKK